MAQQPFKIVENSQKQMPSNIEAEQAVIGSILVSNDIYALSWSKTTLEKLKDRKPELFEKLNALIAKNLCEKLIRSNKK